MEGVSQVMGPNFGNALAQWFLHKMEEKKKDPFIFNKSLHQNAWAHFTPRSLQQ
jgi:hypothetical protein